MRAQLEYSWAEDTREMVLYQRVSDFLKPLPSPPLQEWAYQAERTGSSCQLTHALSPWQVLRFWLPLSLPISPFNWPILSFDLLIPPRRLQPNSAGFLPLAWKTFYLSGTSERSWCLDWIVVIEFTGFQVWLNFGSIWDILTNTDIWFPCSEILIWYPVQLGHWAF